MQFPVSGKATSGNGQPRIVSILAPLVSGHRTAAGPAARRSRPEPLPDPALSRRRRGCFWASNNFLASAIMRLEKNHIV